MAKHHKPRTTSKSQVYGSNHSSVSQLRDAPTGSHHWVSKHTSMPQLHTHMLLEIKFLTISSIFAPFFWVQNHPLQTRMGQLLDAKIKSSLQPSTRCTACYCKQQDMMNTWKIQHQIFWQKYNKFSHYPRYFLKRVRSNRRTTDGCFCRFAMVITLR